MLTKHRRLRAGTRMASSGGMLRYYAMVLVSCEVLRNKVRSYRIDL